MDIREQIAKVLFLIDWEWDTWETATPDFMKEYYRKSADQILALLKENGYVKLADDQKLPDDKTDGHMKDSHDVGYIVAQQDMLKDKFRRVEL